MRAKLIGYWAATGVVASVVLAGGVAYLAHYDAVVAGMVQLGYPLYFVTILGFWKVLGAIVLVVPRLPRAKEWAYAGILLDLTGAPRGARQRRRAPHRAERLCRARGRILGAAPT